jgi:hypothetical protein
MATTAVSSAKVAVVDSSSGEVDRSAGIITALGHSLGVHPH